jgi:A/G-specific adenine glycosylase
LLEENADAATMLRERYGLQLAALQTLPTLRHAFTHFELQLQPLRIQLVGIIHSVRDASSQRWVKLSDAPPALPTPIARLFQQLKMSTDQPCPEPFTA